MDRTYVIAGAGFRGFCDALELLKILGAKVHIIEPAPFFGGIFATIFAKVHGIIAREVERFKEDIARRSRRVVLGNVIPFFRREVYLDSLTVRGLVE